MRTFRRIAEVTGFELPRNMDRMKILGVNRVIGSVSQRDLIAELHREHF